MAVLRHKCRTVLEISTTFFQEMANKKKPGRDAFEAERLSILPSLPTGYGTLLKARRTDWELQHIYHVKAGKALDWAVLEELKKLASENAAKKTKPVAA